MGLLDTLFAGGMQGNPEPDPQEAMLADLFRKLQASQQVQTQGVVNPGAAPAPDTGRVGMFSPSSAAASSAQLPPAVPPLQESPVRDAPQPGVAYAAPPAGLVPQDIAAKMAPQQSQAQRPAAPQREANIWDHLGRLSRGYNSGGLVGGIADMMNTGRDVEQQNATIAALGQRIGDPQMARMIASDPSLMKAIIPSLFAKEPLQMSEIYDSKGRPQKVMLNTKTGQYIPVGGAKGESEKAPSGHQWIDPSDHSKGVSPIPGMEKPIPGELAGKIAMMRMARERIAETRKVFERDWGASDVGKWIAGNAPAVGDISALSGDVGIAQRDIRTGIEAALRTMTGAAAPEQEVVRYMQMFMPGPKDTKESSKQKMDGLIKFMEDAEKLVVQGRGMTAEPHRGAAPAPPAAANPVPSAAPPPQAPAAAPQGRPDAQTAIREAQAAIAKGANPAAVRARLMQMGIQLPPET